MEKLRQEIALLRRTPEEFLSFYNEITDLTDLTSSQLMGMLRTKITNLREECYNANSRYELVLGLDYSGKNEELNQQNWNRIVEQFKRESDDILKLLETKIIGKALAEIDRKERYAVFNDDNVFMTKWNQIRNKSREIIIK